MGLVFYRHIGPKLMKRSSLVPSPSRIPGGPSFLFSHLCRLYPCLCGLFFHWCGPSFLLCEMSCVCAGSLLGPSSLGWVKKKLFPLFELRGGSTRSRILSSSVFLFILTSFHPYFPFTPSCK